MLEPEGLVANPYLEGLRGVQATVTPTAALLSTELDSARSAMDLGAWTSTTADTFYAELSEHVATLGRASDGCLDNLEAKINGRAAKVDASSRDGRWRS